MNRHRFDVLSFVAGVLFVGLALGFLTTDGDIIDGARWVAPLVLVSLGAAGLISVTRRD